MRVLHLIKGLGPGGAERLLVSLASARSCDTALEAAYLLPHKGQLVPELRALGVEVHLLGGAGGLTDPRWVHRALQLVRHRRPDVVHVHSPALAGSLVPLLRLVRRRPALVTTEHNVWPSFGRASRVANGLSLHLVDARLAVSGEVRSSAWARHRDRMEVLIQGIPVEHLRRRRPERLAARTALGISEATVLVATVANFREKKDYPTLMRAAATCADEPRLRFLSIGQGPLEADLHQLHRDLDLGDRFRFLGYHADPPAVVAGADVFVLASRHEGLPIALLEAMALGVPPVATAVGGVPEVITDGIDGVLVPPGDPDALAAALRELAADEARRRRLGEMAARRATDFDIAETQRSLEELYARLLERR